MGGRGSFIKEGGFAKKRYHVVDFVDGVKVLEPKDPREGRGVPERSGTPGTSYVCYRKNGTFKRFITFDRDRMPIYRIDYGVHRGPKHLHVHYFKNGNVVGDPENLHPGHELYEKHKRLLKGVRIWKEYT